MLEWAMAGALVAVAAAAAWWDWRTRRIPNALTVSALGAALVLRAVAGLPELGGGLLGAGICFLVSLPFFLARGLGGGDVKLVTAFGAFLGPERLLPALAATALVGAGMALMAMIRHGVVKRTFWNLYFILLTLGRRTFRGWKTGDEEATAPVTLDTPGAVTVPYGVAMSAGALYGWFF